MRASVSYFVLLAVAISLSACGKESGFPRIYVKNSDKRALIEKIEGEPWAAQAFGNLKTKIDPYVDRHANDPEWIISRLAMYWKEGERYTQCYLKRQNWDRGEGNAPVPTVRMPGMRIWNQYYNVPLEDRTPYNETGDMWGVSRTDPGAAPVLVPYKESGHMIRGNNVEILTLAEEAAFLYWVSGEKRYARFAADIFNTWLMGTYYMNPILDPDKSTGGPGGYEPGGICGYYDYEQIHDDLVLHGALIYDFLQGYLEKNPDERLAETGHSLRKVAGIVFKRFIDIGFVRGGRNGNWNINGWNMILPAILVLEDNGFYADGKGREHYLHYLTTETTEYHEAIPDIVKAYDPVTGLWPESPGYAFGTIQMLLDFAVMLKNSGVDVLADNQILLKAAMAVFPWMDEQANMVVFGDSRGGSANFLTFENLLTYYNLDGSESPPIVGAALISAINSDKYSRAKADWKGICTFVPLSETSGEVEVERASYSPHHRFVTMKNFGGTNKLMATLYGGRSGYHLNSNGLAMQIYGFGYALAPDAAAYESYWSADMAYHQSATGSNTIMPGYAEGEISIVAMEPGVDADEFINTDELNPFIGFADVAAGEKRRTLAMVRTSPDAGYYVDIFRSDQSDNDYIYHNLGTELTISGPDGTPLAMRETSGMGRTWGRGYDWFKNPRRVSSAEAFKARWDAGEISMTMWMTGSEGREIYHVDAPYTTMTGSLTPGGVNTPPSSTHTLIVRQNGRNGWREPFMAVFEPAKGRETSVENVLAFDSGVATKGLIVESRGGRRDRILSSTDGKTVFKNDGVVFQGIFGIVTEVGGEVTMLYLGGGTTLQNRDMSIEAPEETYASVWKHNGEWFYSSDKEIVVTSGENKTVLQPGYHKSYSMKPLS